MWWILENASKALIMAGGVLIAILIISFGVYIFITYGQTSKEIAQRTEEQQIQNFNATYTTYLDRKDLTIYDVRTVVNSAKENNSKYTDNDGNIIEEYKIIVKLNNVELQNKNDDYMNNLTEQDRNAIVNGSASLPTYTCTKILTENENGRVSQVFFTKNT